MANEDKEKWNKKYLNTPELLGKREVGQRLSKIVKNVKNKKALDVACGAGRNSIYLTKHGYQVDAYDISQVALDELNKQNIKNIFTKQVDLDDFRPKIDSYDLIVMTNYLDREIIPHLFLALKKDGILFIETYMEHKENEKPASNPDFLLKKDELKSFFDKNYELLEYDEFFNEPYELYKMRKQAICIRKI
jgi:tellurite methyltransferase